MSYDSIDLETCLQLAVYKVLLEINFCLFQNFYESYSSSKK